MFLKKEQLAAINTLLEGKFNDKGELYARVITRKDRLNDQEIYNKIAVHINTETNMFTDGEVEFNAQEKKYLKDIFEEDMPGSWARQCTAIIKLMYGGKEEESTDIPANS